MNIKKLRIVPNTSSRARSFVPKTSSRARCFLNFPLGNRRALSPLVATVLLVVFALVIGTITMNWGRSYVEKIKEEPGEVRVGVFDSAVIISIKDIDTPLKELQLQYITGKITKEEYIEKEKDLISD